MTPADYLAKPYGRVVFREDDGSYRGEIIEFPGCIAIGDTAAEALAHLEGVAESWLASTIARGQRVPEPIETGSYSGKLVVRLTRSLHRKATHEAAREGVSLNHFIVSCVAEQVGARAKPLIEAQTQAMTFLTPLSHDQFSRWVSLASSGALQLQQYATSEKEIFPLAIGGREEAHA